MVVAEVDLPGADPAAANGILHLDPAEHPAAIGARVVGQVEASLHRTAAKFGVWVPVPLDLLPLGLVGAVPAAANAPRFQPITALVIAINLGRGKEAVVFTVYSSMLVIVQW